MVYTVFAISAIVILFIMFKSGHFLKTLFISVLQGISALFAVNFIGGFIGIHLSLNFFSVITSALSGMPGVIFLLVCDIVDKI